MSPAAFRYAAGLLALGVASLGWLACDGAGSHVLAGRRYLPERDCVEEVTVIDVVEGPDPGRACEVVCLVGSSPVIGEPDGIFVTTQCEPFPGNYDLSQSRAECTPAKEAIAAERFCLADGGTSNPRDDASDDADAASQPDAAATDAASDEDAGDDDAGEADAASDASLPDAALDDAATDAEVDAAEPDAAEPDAAP